MKRPLFHFFILCCLLAAITSCNKDSSSSSTETFDVNLSAGQCHTYDLGTFASDESASITTPPKRHDTSVLRRNSAGDRIIYKYCPTKSFIGSDETVITSTRKSGPITTVTTIRYMISK